MVAIRNKFGEFSWLFHDDNCPPVEWSILPEWFTFDVTHVWLIRSDKYVQWKQPAAYPPSQEIAMGEVLAQLRDP